ncbi:DUF1189 family protein [Candidatus Amesbacteria bacterium]|nr:DUF1189 family protein [Candidatus Amesbacteria bacterium]
MCLGPWDWWLVIGISVLVYYTPQIPKFLNDKLPEISLSIKDGEVSTSLPEPYIWGDKNMALIINTKGTVDDLKEYRSGVLILKNKLLAKNKSETKLIDLSDMKDETKLDKNFFVSWTQNNKAWLLVVGLVILVVVELIVGVFYMLWQALSFLFWSLVLFVLSRLLQIRLEFLNILKIVLVASVVPLLISVLNILFQDKILDMVSIGVFVFYASIWIYHLKPVSK